MMESGHVGMRMSCEDHAEGVTLAGMPTGVPILV